MVKKLITPWDTWGTKKRLETRKRDALDRCIFALEDLKKMADAAIKSVGKEEFVIETISENGRVRKYENRMDYIVLGCNSYLDLAKKAIAEAYAHYQSLEDEESSEES